MRMFLRKLSPKKYAFECALRVLPSTTKSFVKGNFRDDASSSIFCLRFKTEVFGTHA